MLRKGSGCRFYPQRASRPSSAAVGLHRNGGGARADFM